ncbi:uncharacterized protein [Procambarus clarkii]|uniref:uncharacterized protein n=1 Tax=Procambarus clarkii TaxID=6728 RepID=UPI00374446BC
MVINGSTFGDHVGSNGSISRSNVTNDSIWYLSEDLSRLRQVIEEVIENGYKKTSSSIIRELRVLLKTDNATDVSNQTKSEDSLAVLYIVFVLFFFAASLLVLLIKYLRRERESSRLQQFYEDYLDVKDPRVVVHYDSAGRRLHVREPSGASTRLTSVSLAATPTSSPSQTPITTPSHTPITTPSHTPITTPSHTPPSSPTNSVLPVYPIVHDHVTEDVI